jgi:hypothetical protein
MGFPIQNFKNHFIGISQPNFLPLFSAPWAWVGLLGGPAAAAYKKCIEVPKENLEIFCIEIPTENLK